MLNQLYDNRSFKFKITCLCTLAAGTAIFIVSLCFILFEIGTFKRDLQNNQLMQLDLVASTLSAPLVFNDTDAMDDAISGFKKLELVEGVAVFGPEKKIRSQFSRSEIGTGTHSPIDLIDTISSRSYQFDGNLLKTQVPVYVHNDLVGAVVSHTRLDRLAHTITNYLIIAMSVIPMALCLAYLLGRIVSQRLARPIETLAQTMSKVKKTNDYDLRVDVGTDNEMGHLADNFNQMLKEIRLRDQRLELQTRELVAEKDRAQDASKAKSEFLANMSHELRTPMNGILGMTEILIQSGLEDQQREFANIIYRSGSALTTILNDILDFSKIEANKLSLSLKPFNIRDLISDVTDLLDNKARSKNIELTTQFNPQLAETAIGDEGRIRQILTNIVGNAVKFTHEGSVKINVRGKKEKGQYKLSISVADSGIGIPAEKLQLVFQKFTQAETSTTRDYGGTGLGLAISQRLVEIMGGQIGVRSEPGSGSTFWFEIMLGMADTPTLITPTDSQDVQIAIVTSREKIRNVLGDKLAQTGISTRVYEAASEATDWLKTYTGRPPLLIIEHNTDSRESLGFIKTFRQTYAASQAPILILQTKECANLNASIDQFGNVSTLCAPIKLKNLFGKISDLIADKKTNSLRNLISPSQSVMPQVPAASPKLLVVRGAPKSLKRPRILVADDNETNRVVIEHMIDTDAYDLEFVVDGKQALDAHFANPYDLILMDISMPVLGGMDATKAIREYERLNNTPPVPIIATTAHAMKDQKSQFLRAGMDDYLAKPMRNSDLDKVLETWLRSQRVQQNQKRSA